MNWWQQFLIKPFGYYLDPMLVTSRFLPSPLVPCVGNGGLKVHQAQSCVKMTQNRKWLGTGDGWKEGELERASLMAGGDGG